MVTIDLDHTKILAAYLLCLVCLLHALLHGAHPNAPPCGVMFSILLGSCKKFCVAPLVVVYIGQFLDYDALVATLALMGKFAPRMLTYDFLVGSSMFGLVCLLEPLCHS